MDLTQAMLVKAGSELSMGVILLEGKYPQYATMPLVGQPLIIVQVDHVTSWRAF
jgi:hypothetical protein